MEGLQQQILQLKEQTQPSCFFRKEFFLLERRYLLSSTEKKKVSWADARHLVPQRKEAAIILKTLYSLISLLNSFNVVEHLWLGGSDLATEGIWHDVSSKPINVRSSLWNKNQPDNHQGNENCIHLSYSEGKYGWNDNKCVTNYNFICEHQPI
ncbi:C-type lectin domain family 4 member F-like 2 [Homarus americanus]|uniref:C-type lectin domain family 4 member F-like 2 n=1 Tax=Homarus americanus TaxID=6706 RepID=A0A8J5N3R6_HOMAM|nr:C-type lectin domain family 4 member F-like 2 [Homarus americanus]